MIENYNYWRDPRVIASMIDSGKVIEDDGRKYIVIEASDDEDIRVLCRWGICDLCDGDGTTVNPSIDASGLTAEDWDRDPDFAKDYRNGMYDITCTQCKGKRVVPVPDERGDPGMLKRYEKWMSDEHDYAALCAAERAMGA